MFVFKLKTFHKIKKCIRPKQSWVYLLFVIGIIPRVILQLINKEWNDDHMTPILLWMQNGIYPEVQDCWECFQPPFFYTILNGFCSLVNANSFTEIFNVIQVFNIVLSIGILWMILRYIETLNLHKWLAISSMLFWGLNPELISIGALATNDLLLIFLGFITSMQFIKQWKKETLVTEIFIFILLFVMSITKGNGLVFVGAFGLLILLLMLKNKIWNWLKIGRQAILFITLFISIAFVGKYQDKYIKHGNAFITNVDPPWEKAQWSKEGEAVFRKGVNTIHEAYFTFPFTSLLETPYNENNTKNTQLHRQNIWTQFIGQFSNYLFERYPEHWISVNNDQYNFERVNYILHLLLFLLIFYVYFDIFRKPKKAISHPLFVHSILVILFLAFVIKYSAMYRDFSFMKVIFLYPVYLSLISLYTFVFTKLKFQKVLIGVLLSCSILYLINFVYLIKALI